MLRRTLGSLEVGHVYKVNSSVALATSSHTHTHITMDSFTAISVPAYVPTNEETGGSGNNAYCVVA
ncbi:hypothetical protein B0H34DRAFT_715643 [Crassisporium funariophilum]|nr:hypothetical protein B0H34DRAFT_715643 [Crassisporium funariophilum]